MSCLAALGFSKEDIKLASENDARGVMVFKGGETAGLHRVQEYIFDNDCLKVCTCLCIGTPLVAIFDNYFIYTYIDTCTKNIIF
jgi:hypothetical protein